MSNLIIALIGVALFTGCLLYGGAVFGPRIEDGQVAASSSRLFTDLSRAVSAINRYRLGREVYAGSELGSLAGMVTAGYLGAEPVNPVSAAKTVEIADSAGRTYAEYGTVALPQASFEPGFVVVSLGTDNLMCTWFARQVGSIARAASVSTTGADFASSATFQAGCFKGNYASGNIASGDYVAYVRL